VGDAGGVVCPFQEAASAPGKLRAAGIRVQHGCFKVRQKMVVFWRVSLPTGLWDSPMKSPTGRTDGTRVILDRGLSLPPSGAQTQQRQAADRQQR